ncbi:MAG: glycosyl hydrolase [Candidatus Margulisiibacteriota bacterium]
MVECGPIRPNGIYPGVFLGDNVTVSSYTLGDFAQTSGAKVKIDAKFSAFGQGLKFPMDEALSAARSGTALFIKLEPWNPAEPKNNPYSLRDIADRKYDALLTGFARQVKAFGQPILITFAHEMNLVAYPWGKANPAEYKAAFHHVHELFRQAGACNVTWVFNPDAQSNAEAYYPGDDVVDWIAVDGYSDIGKRQSCSEIFDQRFTEYKNKHPDKTLMIGEFGYNSYAPDENQRKIEEKVNKPAWLKECIDYVADGGKIKAFVYFNTDKMENGQTKKWAVKSPEARHAYREAMKEAERKHEDIFRGRILTPAPLEETRRSSSGAADFALGRYASEMRPVFDEKKIKAAFQTGELDLPAVEAALAAVIDQLERAPDEKFNPLTGDRNAFASRFRDLERIADIDRSQKHELVQYFRHPREYWNNAIALLSAYTQEIMETGQTFKLSTVLEWSALILAELENLERQNKTVPKAILNESSERVLPSDFNWAMLYFIEAETLSQLKNQTPADYQQGIDLTLTGLKKIFEFSGKNLYPSMPDFFIVSKGVLVLGDLYSKLANLTKKEEYYAAAFQLYRSVSNIDEKRGMNLEIDLPAGLDSRTATKVEPFKDRKEDILFDLTGRHLKISTSAAGVERALEFNIERDYIEREKKEQAISGFYNYQKGIALLKQAGLVVAWPRIKTIEEAVEQIGNVEIAKKELTTANERTGKNKNDRELISTLSQKFDATLNSWVPAYGFPLPESLFLRAYNEASVKTDRINSSFFLELAKLTEGELILMLADQISSHQEKEADRKKNAEMVDKLKQLPEVNGRFEAALKGLDSDETNKQLRKSEALINTARDHYFTGINPRFKYLYVWSQAKLGEIALRTADFVYIADQYGAVLPTRQHLPESTHITDAARLLAWSDRIDNMFPDSGIQKSEYIGVNFDYCRTTFMLAGKAMKSANGRYKTVVELNDLDPNKTIKLVDEIIANNLDELSDSDRQYFTLLLNQKKAGALIQLKDKKDGKIKVKQALEILRTNELLIAPPIPPHIYDKLVDIHKVLAGQKVEHYDKNEKTFKEKTMSFADMLTIIQPLKVFVDRYTTVTANEDIVKLAPSLKAEFAPLLKNRPAEMKELSKKLDELTKLIKQKDKTAAAQAKVILDLVEKIDVSRRFESEIKQKQIWDFHSTRAELYHFLAVARSISSEVLPKDHVLYEYVQSAYHQSRRSTTSYDRLIRPYYIYADFGDFTEDEEYTIPPQLNNK